MKSWESLHAGQVRALRREIKSSDIHEILRNRKRKKESVIEIFHEMKFIASQDNLTLDEVRGYTSV